MVSHMYEIHMTLVVKKFKSKGDNSYYKLVDQKKVNGKVVQKYVGYLSISEDKDHFAEY